MNQRALARRLREIANELDPPISPEALSFRCFQQDTIINVKQQVVRAHFEVMKSTRLRKGDTLVMSWKVNLEHQN